jgi:hypothetical protein
LDSPGSYDALLRVSRGVGFSGELPDVIGWALRVHDAFGSGQPFDLMLASTGRAPIARHVLMPTRGFVASTASSLFRYDVSGRSRFLAALPIVTGSGTERTVPEYRLCIASRWGRWREVARVEVGEQAPAEVGAALHFNVVRNSDRSLHPAGWVQGLRNRAYVSSERAAPQSGRDDVEPRAGEPVVAPSVHG